MNENEARAEIERRGLNWRVRVVRDGRPLIAAGGRR